MNGVALSGAWVSLLQSPHTGVSTPPSPGTPKKSQKGLPEPPRLECQNKTVLKKSHKTWQRVKKVLKSVFGDFFNIFWRSGRGGLPPFCGTFWGSLGKRKHTPPCSSAELLFAEKKIGGHRGKISVVDIVFLIFIGFLYSPPAWKVFLWGQKSSPKFFLSVVVVYALFFSGSWGSGVWRLLYMGMAIVTCAPNLRINLFASVENTPMRNIIEFIQYLVDTCWGCLVPITPIITTYLNLGAFDVPSGTPGLPALLNSFGINLFFLRLHLRF